MPARSPRRGRLRRLAARGSRSFDAERRDESTNRRGRLFRRRREQRFELGECEDVLRSSSGALQADESREVNAEAWTAEEIEADRVSQQRIVASTSRCFTEQIERPEIRVEREIQAALDRGRVELEGQAGGTPRR